MYYRNRFAAFALGALALLASCAKEGPTGPTGPVGPSFTGTVTGHLFLYDKYGSQVLWGYEKASLSLSGPSVTARTAVPNTAGLYTYNTVTTGTYALTVTDSAYGATRMDNVNFVSGTLYQDVSLSAIPDSFVTGFGAVALAGYDSLTIHAVPDARERSCIVFVNSARLVGNTPAYYLLRYVVRIPANATAVTMKVPAQDLTNAGLASGSKAYYGAYSYVVNDASMYEDMATGRGVYNSVFPRAFVDSALVP